MPWVIIFGAWTLVGSFYATRGYVAALSGLREVPDISNLVANLGDAYIWALFTPPILWLVRRYRFQKGGWGMPLALHLVAGALFAAASVAINVIVWRWLHPEDPSSFARYFAQTFHWNVQWYWIIVGIGHLLDYYRRFRDREFRALHLETQLATAQVQALKMQLQPHFLFNTLHAISELVHENPDAADRMITRLGDLLRLSIDAAGVQQVSLKQELEFLSAYLEIQQTRFQDRLTVQMEIQPDTLDAQVPNLLLQPLVENAIRHGLAFRAAPGEIAITAKRRNGTLRLVVRDNGAGLPSAGVMREGVGLGNTRARLQQIYGADHFFHLYNDAAGGVVATVMIPFRTAPDTAVIAAT